MMMRKKCLMQMNQILSYGYARSLFTIEYDLNGVNKASTKRYARYVHGEEFVNVFGDMRSWGQKIKDVILGKKLDVPILEQTEPIKEPELGLDGSPRIIDADVEKIELDLSKIFTDMDSAKNSNMSKWNDEEVK